MSSKAMCACCASRPVSLGILCGMCDTQWIEYNAAASACGKPKYRSQQPWVDAGAPLAGLVPGVFNGNARMCKNCGGAYTGAGILCTKCHISYTNYTATKHSVSATEWVALGTTLISWKCSACCDIMRGNEVMCAHCGLAQPASFDATPAADIDVQPTKKCTCGSASVGSSRHSDWCDIK